MTPEQKIALVTGANKGIGYEIARGLGKKGMTVLLGCRDSGRAETAAARLRQEGLSAVPVLLDVTRAETVKTVAEHIDSAYGRLDVLVNNAGIAHEWTAKPTTVPMQVVRETYETNVFGPIAVTQTMLPLLVRSAAGRIVNVSSHLGSFNLSTNPDWSGYQFLALAYCSSKSALNAVTVQFAKELGGTAVKINAICPGYVATDINNNSGPRTPEEGARIAIEMAMAPEDGPTGGFFDDSGRVPW